MLVGADGKLAQRTIRTGALVDGQWLVEDGLQDGERVVVGGTQKLRPGVAVKVREAAPPSSRAQPLAQEAAATGAGQGTAPPHRHAPIATAAQAGAAR
jgi:membrane fusion protein, multidrug efflux system